MTDSDSDPKARHRFGGLIQRVAGTSGSLTPGAAFERFQGIVRAAVVQMASKPGSGGELSESFYSRLRASLLDAGAVDGDFEALAYSLVRFIVDTTAPDFEERDRQFELISHHLVCADMMVRIAPGDTNVRVEFPDRFRH